MRVMKFGGLLASMLFLAACVTINIYFPAAQAEQAAEKIVDDILSNRPEERPAETTDDKGASLNGADAAGHFARLVDWIIPSAHAAEPDFTVNTPKIRQLQASMKARNAALAPFYNSGAIGFTRDALIAVHDNGAIGLKDRARVNNLMSDENSDRNALYRAIAEANGHPEWEGDVRAVFARTWVQQAAKGWWYQNGKGQWVQK